MLRKQEELLDAIEDLIVSFERTKESIDDSLKKSKWYRRLMQGISFVFAMCAIYTGVVGFAGSAAVFATLFFLFWVVTVIADTISKSFLAYAEGKKYELQKEVKKLRATG